MELFRRHPGAFASASIPCVKHTCTFIRVRISNSIPFLPFHVCCFLCPACFAVLLGSRAKPTRQVMKLPNEFIIIIPGVWLSWARTIYDYDTWREHCLFVCSTYSFTVFRRAFFLGIPQPTASTHGCECARWRLFPPKAWRPLCRLDDGSIYSQRCSS